MAHSARVAGSLLNAVGLPELAVDNADDYETLAVRLARDREALADIRDASTPPPTAVDGSGRSAQRFELVVRLVQNGVVRTAGVRGQDIYAVTAPLVLEAAQRLMAPAYQRSGALALGEAVDSMDTLRALNGQALEVFGDVQVA